MMSSREALNDLREELRVISSDGMPHDVLTIGQLEGLKSIYGKGHERKAGLGYLYERFDS